MAAGGIVGGQDARTMLAEVSDRDGSGRSPRQTRPPLPAARAPRNY
jgi:hypothetical protein